MWGGGGVPTGGALKGHTSFAGEDEGVGGTSTGAGSGGEVARVITYPGADTNGDRGGTLNIQWGGWLHQAHSRGRNFEKGAEEALEVPAGDGCSS